MAASDCEPGHSAIHEMKEKMVCKWSRDMSSIIMALDQVSVQDNDYFDPASLRLTQGF